MRVFLSWSGEPSRRVASALNEFLPTVLQATEPWFSEESLDPGVRWESNLEYALETSEFAIICLTPENINSAWVNYEIGSLISHIGSVRVCPYLIGFSPSELTGPLVAFQAVEATREGTWRLFQSLNHLLEDQGIPESALQSAFDASWPKLSSAIKGALPPELENQRTESSLHDMLEEILEQLSSGQPTPTRPQATEENPFVFLVHGRAHGTAETVARFVEKLGPRVVILHEQANKGRTIIEKFEQNSNVAFAIALLTADDQGGLIDGEPRTYGARARQNVIFELGYFIGKLGRRLVAVLYEDGVELPSDFLGVAYIPLDSAGAWRLTLARELRAAELSIDLNAAL